MQTKIDLVEHQPEGITLVRLRVYRDDGSTHLHRTSLAPDTPVMLQGELVNTHLQQMSFPPLPAEQWAQLKAVHDAHLLACGLEPVQG